MKIMVCGGCGRRMVDASLAEHVIDRLRDQVATIDLLIRGKDDAGNSAALTWWAKRMFNPGLFPGRPDVVIVLPGPTSLLRLREALADGIPVILVDEGGVLQFFEGRKPMMRGVA